ncbi:hypothetical protein MNBD_NITROSPINAE04-992 [hydrothermal vent metagenome]|uniref:Uncharacterized protein n=1 Tax=hydrothermal vent metagenome TaxID=652676 RepID=A0A3B1CN23_9ZZZZ
MMKSAIRFFLLFFFTLFLACGGGNSSNDAATTSEPDAEESISESVKQYLSLWAEAMLAENTSALEALISTDYMNSGLGYSSRVSALEGVLNQINITSYSLELVSVESYDGVNAEIKIRTIYTYDWLLSPGCSPSVDRTSTSHLTGDGSGGWLNAGNQNSSYVAPSNDGFNTGAGSTVAKCIDFDDRVTGKKNMFGPDDYAIYAMYHVKNVLGPSLGSYEWVRPDGTVHYQKKFSFKASSDRYSGWSVSAILRISGNVNLFNKNEGEWKLVGHVSGINGSADFSNSFYYSASSTSRESRSSELAVNEAGVPLSSLVQNGPILR